MYIVGLFKTNKSNEKIATNPNTMLFCSFGLVVFAASDDGESSDRTFESANGSKSQAQRIAKIGMMSAAIAQKKSNTQQRTNLWLLVTTNNMSKPTKTEKRGSLGKTKGETVKQRSVSLPLQQQVAIETNDEQL